MYMEYKLCFDDLQQESNTVMGEELYFGEENIIQYVRKMQIC